MPFQTQTPRGPCGETRTSPASQGLSDAANSSGSATGRPFFPLRDEDAAKYPAVHAGTLLLILLLLSRAKGRAAQNPLPPSLRGKPQHAGHPPNNVEMTWHHGTPGSSVQLLLLLLFTSFGPVRSCKFRYPPIDTSDFSRDVKPLKDYLLLDYGVLMPSNLKTDKFCGELWDLHLINENLKKLIGISGKCLAELFMKLYNHTKFIESCNIKVNSSINFVQANISQFVDLVPLRLQSLSKKMEDLTAEGNDADFQNCTVIQCQIESSTVTIRTSTQKMGKKESSQSAPPRRSYWGLLLLPVLLVSLVFVLWKQLQHSSSAAV